MKNPFINNVRLSVIKLGYVNQDMLSSFLDIDVKEAERAYLKIKHQIEKQGRRVDARGLPVLDVLSYMGYTIEDICSLAEEEKRWNTYIREENGELRDYRVLSAKAQHNKNQQSDVPTVTLMIL